MTSITIPTFKVNILEDNKVVHVILFLGDAAVPPETDDDYAKHFSPIEIDQIARYNIPVSISHNQIFMDDTVAVFKLKLLDALIAMHNEGKLPQGIAPNIASMYFFCRRKILLNLGNIYNILTQYGKLRLTANLMTLFLNNLLPPGIGMHQQPISAIFDNQHKEITLADFITICNKYMSDPNASQDDMEVEAQQAEIQDSTSIYKWATVSHPIGQRTWLETHWGRTNKRAINIRANIANGEYLVYNPFQIAGGGDIEQASMRALQKLLGAAANYANFSIPTNDNKLIMDTGNILNHGIFLCLANNVFSSAPALKFDIQQNIIKTYYPLLGDEQIYTAQQLAEKAPELATESAALLDDKARAYIHDIALYYDVYALRTRQLKYISRGIRSIRICINPTHFINVSLENLFKIIHATQAYPMIKYNPSLRQENLFKLYAPTLSTDGRKIPYLKRALIMRIMREMGANKTVSIYVDGGITCEIDETGRIFIDADFSKTQQKLLTVQQVDDLFRTATADLLDNIQTYFEQNGYKLDRNNISIYSYNVDIVRLDYEWTINAGSMGGNKQLNLSRLKGCLASAFSNETAFFKRDIHLRYKRVSNYNTLSSQEAYIMDKAKEGLPVEIILDLLQENFKRDIDKSTAAQLINRIIAEQQILRSAGYTSAANDANSVTTKNENPGFSVTFALSNDKHVLASHQTILTISALGIDQVGYLDTLPVYIDTILRLLLSTDRRFDTAYPVTNIETYCLSADAAVSPDFNIVLRDDIAADTTTPTKIDLDLLNVDTAAMDAAVATADDIEQQHHIEDLLAMYGDYDDDDAIPPQVGGADITEEEEEETDDDMTVYDIDKLRLKRFFQNRIQRRDPHLFANANNNYSRECQANSKRQPIALTDAELAALQKEYPQFLRKEDVISYQSSAQSAPVNYVCPRYWCLKTNSVIDPSEMEEFINEQGKRELRHPTCGRIIPNKAKFITPGHYVYEFYKPGDAQYPGLIPGKTKQDPCMPCCFTKWNTLGRMDALKKCNIYGKNAPTSRKATAKTAYHDGQDISDMNMSSEDDLLPNDDNNIYIMGPDKTPLPFSRWGYLPMQLQFFLKEMSVNCQISKMNTAVKPGWPCIMRHGVENNPLQSFLACISSLLYYGEGTPIRSIKEFKRYLTTTAITLDNFVGYQNGDLATVFATSANNNNNNNNNNQKEEADYAQTQLYQATAKQDPQYFARTVAAFENFKRFIMDDQATVDHTYMWDVFALPNPQLFIRGLNIIMFNIVNSDITNNIQIVCPTNQYAAAFFDPSKPTVFIVKQYEYYEPIYSYMRMKDGRIHITKAFSEYDKNLSSSIRAIINNVIRPFMTRVCKPLASMPNRYIFKTAPTFIALIEKLATGQQQQQPPTIEKIVINFQSKVIGVEIVMASMRGFIPCFPSAIDMQEKDRLGAQLVFMTDATLWQAYEPTIVFLRNVVQQFGIPCKPVFQILEDGLIVGILTETDQFIQITDPQQPASIDPAYHLPAIKQSGYLLGSLNRQPIDQYIANNSDEMDTDRVEYVTNIKKETQFYNTFRNVIKVLINYYEHADIKQSIQQQIDDILTIYNEKFAAINTLLRNLVGQRIQFIGDENYHKRVTKMDNCVIMDKKQCRNLSVCDVDSRSGQCFLVLPRVNLITGKQNEEIYFGRFTDELIRYNHIRSYIMEPYNLVSFGNKPAYNLRDNEIVMLQSLITPEFFDGLVPVPVNKYITNVAYDVVEPIRHQEYDNVVALNAVEGFPIGFPDGVHSMSNSESPLNNNNGPTMAVTPAIVVQQTKRGRPRKVVFDTKSSLSPSEVATLAAVEDAMYTK